MPPPMIRTFLATLNDDIKLYKAMITALENQRYFNGTISPACLAKINDMKKTLAFREATKRDILKAFWLHKG